MKHPFFVTVPHGMESLLAGELRSLGAQHIKQARAGVSFEGTLEDAYRVCLWSRLAGRVLLPLTSGPAGDGDELYATTRRVLWDNHMDADGTLAVDFTGVSETIRDTRYGAVRMKDAVADQFRERHGDRRPSVDARDPDLRINGHLMRGRITVSLDLSGESLHRRGYRTDRVQVEAPLKENLAAAMLLYAAWPQEAAAGGSFLDPLCGSGTLPIEAAMIAADVAPGLVRAGFEPQPDTGGAREAAAASGREAGTRGGRGAGTAGGRDTRGAGRREAGAHGGRETGTGGGREAGGAAAPAFGFVRWRGHDAAAWAALLKEARERRKAGLERLKAAGPGQTVRGSDHDPRAIEVAQMCVRRAGLAGVVAVTRGDLRDARPSSASGLVAANLPYGERLGRREDAEALTAQLGDLLQRQFAGWRAALLTGSPQQAQAAGLAIARETALRNGPLECTLAFCDVTPGQGRPAPSPSAAARSARAAVRSSSRAVQELPPDVDMDADADEWELDEDEDRSGPAPEPAAIRAPAPPRRPAGMLGGGAEQLANRLHKNLRRLGKQLRREGIACYRAYDADLPEYNFVVDVYGDWVHVQEYAPPSEIDPAKAERRLEEAVAVVGAVLEVPPDRVVLKQRRRQRGAAQYERRTRSGVFEPVKEDDLTYLVNLTDYLDTGLFLDQRLTRRLVRTLAGGRRFLNLFAYTGTMTVDALAGGAPSSTTVDLSSTYLEWAQRNLQTNGFTSVLEPGGAEGAAGGPRRGHADEHGSRGGRAGAPASSPHRLVQADCLRWLAEAGGRYDLIWLDPPTFSNSKRMGRATFDVQRDHTDLLRMTARRLLAPGGVLLFATNRRGFRLERNELTGLTVTDLSRSTLPFDCTRAANRHHVFRLEHTSPH